MPLPRVRPSSRPLPAFALLQFLPLLAAPIGCVGGRTATFQTHEAWAYFPARACAGKDAWGCWVAGLETLDRGELDAGAALLEGACEEGEPRACTSADALARLRGRAQVRAFAAPSGPLGNALALASTARTDFFPRLFSNLETKRAACGWVPSDTSMVACLVASGAELAGSLRALDRSLREGARVTLAIPGGPGLRMGGFTFFLPRGLATKPEAADAAAFALPHGGDVSDAARWRVAAGSRPGKDALPIVWVTPRGLLSGSYAHELAHVSHSRDSHVRRCMEDFWEKGLDAKERVSVKGFVEATYGSLSERALREEMHAYLLQDAAEVQPIAGRLQASFGSRYIAWRERSRCGR